MNFRKLLTYLTVGTAAVIPYAGAQNPTILQGNYITNVFGQSNFILNPNAQTNVANVTVSSATVTRSTTTPLVATSEFNVAIGTANGTATWATRTFDAGMKGQNCEARFTYRGFAATSKVHIKQSTNTVATLNLTPATDPRIASINFPCGDLSTATTFVVTDTAILAGTNEIGGIYTGLATNQANVAQAEAVLNVFRNTTLSVPTATDTTVLWNDIGLDALGEYTAATGIYKAKRAGQYLVSAQILYDNAAWTATNQNDLYILKNNALTSSNVNYLQATVTTYITAQVTATVALAVGDEIKIAVRQGTGSTRNLIANGTYNHLKIYRFPTSSELVVTPERQNTFGGAQWTSAASFSRSNTTEITMSSANFATNRTLFGKAQFTGTANDVAITIPSMPPGSYKVQLAGKRFSAQKTAAGTSDFGCTFTIKDGTNSTSIAPAQYGVQYSVNSMTIATAVFTYSSLADRTFTAYLNGNDTNSVDCAVDQPKIIITPLDQPSNSALYVQGPVLSGQTGSVLPVGYIGEIITSASSATGTFANGIVTQNVGTLTLTPGTWLVSANVSFITPNTFNFNSLSISLTSATFDFTSSIQPQAAVAGAYDSLGNLMRIVRVTANTPIYAVTRTWVPTGTSTYQNMLFSAVRIGSN